MGCRTPARCLASHLPALLHDGAAGVSSARFTLRLPLALALVFTAAAAGCSGEPAPLDEHPSTTRDAGSSTSDGALPADSGPDGSQPDHDQGPPDAGASDGAVDGSLGNRPPRFDPVPDQQIPLGFSVSFRVSAHDPEGQPLQLEAPQLPAGASFDPVAAVFAWTPNGGQLGEHVAMFGASDGEQTTELSVVLTVFWPHEDPDDPGDPGDDPGCAAGQTPCAGICCPPDQLCLFNACVAPGEACAEDDECGLDERCDQLVGRCLPEGGGQGGCVFVPPVGRFSPEVGCRWTPPQDHPHTGRRDVVMAPVVANLTDDNGDDLTDLNDIPELVFTSYNLDGGCCNVAGTIRVVSGRCNSDGTMQTLATLNEFPVDNSAGLALGDLTGDGVPEIVAILISNSRPRGTIALRRTAADGTSWEELWRNPDLPAWNQHTRGGAQPALADINADGTPDVVVGNVVLNGLDGSALWDGIETSGGNGGIGNNAFLGPISVAGDLDLDGRREVAAGNTLYRADGSVDWTFQFPSHNSACGGDLPCDGFTAMANFDDDPQGEVVIVRRGVVYILQHTGDLLWSVNVPKAGCDYNESGPPTVADFDGDGRPEIGTAGADYYVVADPDCHGEPLPVGCDSEGILWKVRNQDCSSRVTASSVFDFEGDGQAEVVYADEQKLRIFRGADGEILYEDDAHGSHTRVEEAIIADVDNDGNAEVVIASNRSHDGQPGIKVYQDADDNWVRTRRIWNQHGYHISNVREDGRVPRVEVPNWLRPETNSFRQNVQPDGLFNAPDLTVELAAGTWECPSALNLQATVRNEGSLGVAAGLKVTLYRGRQVQAAGDPEPEVLAVLATAAPLLVGGSLQLEHRLEIPAAQQQGTFDFFARVDDRGDGSGLHNECDEENNVDELQGVVCESLCPDGIDWPQEERCDDIDNDCDGLTDEQLFRGCATVCGSGFERCEHGAWVDCSAAAPGAEACNLRDDDCNGVVDDGDELCEPSWACIEGVCRMPCQAGECPPGLQCVNQYCLPL